MPELLGVGAFGAQGDREVERRAVAQRAFHPDLASVHLHDLLNDREAEASPGNRLRGAAADSPEALEDMADLVGRDADARVGDTDQNEAALGPAGESHSASIGRVL